MNIEREPGTVWPDEYDWESQFAEALNGEYGYVTIDAGKVRGIVLSYKELLGGEVEE